LGKTAGDMERSEMELKEQTIEDFERGHEEWVKDKQRDRTVYLTGDRLMLDSNGETIKRKKF
jgi:hypothetical protein